ncbi:type VI secretion system-associated protein TagF [Massilia eurypsychrophila]|jgi:type VI secretion system protein ImpM|uniref:Type VI secretion system-associated protein TagF n=1 Tax=Massilia eurypsychrophila TaxID=1485217 RepID=A0A2G8TG29_9BURK|nr:type VI secretion system-associated protein TagF [Massilia eurypsychrophila]PIL44996.1 type VI secretion system-associated protein TagF [Massilia eurypsychrophila]
MVGFFGKVSTHGDFVARRLAPSFQQPWDAWLQAGLQASRQALGERWLATYLCSPIWRFALAPGVCGERACAGVLMPSVDRVGRHFPLTVASEGGAPLDQLMQQGHWYERLEELALSALGEHFSLDAFDAALCALAMPAQTKAPPAVLSFERGQAVDERLLRAIAAAALDEHSMWWSDGSAQVAPCLVVCRGLPAFAALLGASSEQAKMQG